MSELALTPVLTRQQIAAKDRSKPLKVTGRLKRALDLMAWQCKTDSQAAVEANIDVLSIRRALHLPHVRAYYKAQRDVLLERESAADIHRLIAIRDKAENMPAVNAIKLMHEMRSGESAARSTGSLSLPGLTIQIINTGAATDVNASLTRSDAKPLIEHEDGSHDSSD
jgi:hypothetical protein